MLTIHKYLVDYVEDFKIAMHAGAMILKIDIQYTRPVMWALVDTDKPICPRLIHVLMTGQEVPRSVLEHAPHLASVQTGPLVVHYFDGGEVG